MRLRQQTALLEYLDRRGLPGYQDDKVIDRGICGMERPDRLYAVPDGSHLVLELDEDQHRGRACACEQTRMVNIANALGGAPVRFVRVNPDRYLPATAALPLVPVAQRHELAGDLIAGILRGTVKPPHALVSVIYLFFDGWSSYAEEEWTTLVPYVQE